MSQNDFAFTRDSLYGTQAEPTFAGATSFMRRRFSRDLDGVDLAITGVPFDSAASHRPGTRFGPRAIRDISAATLPPDFARNPRVHRCYEVRGS